MTTPPCMRNGNMPVHSTSTPSNTPDLSIAAQGAQLLAELAAQRQADSDNRPVRIVLPRHLFVEPADLEKFLNDDPLVGTRGAAIILGVSADLLKKWRQRGKGPDYYQYEDGGPVLYGVRALNAFKVAYLVTPGKKGCK